jgi:hypothetical protein
MARPHGAGDERPRLGLLEINLGGVTVRPLRDRLLRSKSLKIAVRKLVKPPHVSQKINEVLRVLSEKLITKKYNGNLLSLSASMLLSHFAHGTSELILKGKILDLA